MNTSTLINMCFRNRKHSYVFFVFLFPYTVFSQINVNSTVTPANIVNSFIGSGSSVSNITMNCNTGSYGTFSNGSTTVVGLDNGIILSTGLISNAIGANTTPNAGNCNDTTFSDPDLLALDPNAIHDPCILEFDFTPHCTSMTINFVFGSDEYPEWVDSLYNDVFGFFVTGPNPAGGSYTNYNIARLPDNTVFGINTINATQNSGYFVDNTGGADIQYDGLTIQLSATINLTPCESYHFKIAIADAEDCFYDSGVFLDFTQCEELSASTVTLSPAGCDCSGSASVSASGGVPPYTYSWAPSGGNAATATGLCAGTYTVTIYDSISCTPPIMRMVTIPGNNMTVTPSQTNVLCNGACTGTATVTPSGGVPPYTYLWSNGATASSVNGLCAGTYTVAVADSTIAGCPDTISFTITEPTALNLSISSKTDNCITDPPFVNCSGSIYMVPSGGIGPPYTYSWSPGGQTTNYITHLCGVNTFTLTVTDMNGCQESANATIQNVVCPPPCICGTEGCPPCPPPDPCATNPVTVLATVTDNVSCYGGNDGTANATPLGGVGPYTYYWGNGDTTATADSLYAITYSVFIKDSRGCFSNTASAKPTQPTRITSDSSFTSASCTTPNGTATVTPSGGTPGYTYLWSSGGQVTATATGLAAGSYSVTITDANGCIKTTSVVVPVATNGTAVSITASSPICYNSPCNDSALAVPSGGVAPYTFSWSNTSIAEKITGLCIGSYSVTVTDATGCTATDSITITEPPELTLTESNTANTCLGNGTATVIATGGLPPYTYQWSNGQTTATASSLFAGTYTVTVTDSKECMKSTVSTVGSIFSGAVTIPTFTNVSCYGDSTGSATALMTGGSPPHYYSWNTVPEQHTPTITGLTAGTYIVTVTERAGCIVMDTITITEPPVLTAAITPTNISCNGANDGTAIVNAAGGTPPYNYLWSNNSISQQISNLSPGLYSVTVTDSLGCTVTLDTTITQPTPLSPSILNTAVMASCNGVCDGTATGSVSGGTPAYTYSWNTTPVQNTATAIGLCAGSYTCTFTDANNCIDSASVTITEPPVVLISAIANDTICPGATATLTASVSGGNPGGYTYSWDAPANPAFATTSSVNVSPVSTTSYTVHVSDSLHGCPAAPVTAIVVLNPPLTIVASGAVSFCDGDSTQLNGSAANGTGGPYTYSWTPAGSLNDATISNPVASPHVTTTYTVTLTDGCLQPIFDTVTVTVFPKAIVSAGTDLAVCIGNSAILSGSLSGAALSGTWSGGTGIYTPDNTSPNAIYTPSAAEETAGTVTLTYTTNDPVGPCPAASDQVTITINPLANANAGSTQYVCAGSGITLAGSIGGAATSGTWSGGSGTYSPDNTTLNAVYTASAAEFAAGSVTLTLTTNDPEGPCTVSSSLVTFHFYKNPVVDFTGDTLAGCPIHCVDFTNLSTIDSGNTITSYSWGFGDGSTGTDSLNPSHCFSQTGYYDITLTAVSNNGCTSTLTKTHYVEVYDVPVAAFYTTPTPATILNPIITMNNQSSADVTYWHWDFGDGDTLAPDVSSPTHTYQSLSSDSYLITLIVHNEHNCYDTVSQEIVVEPAFIFHIPNSFTPNGDGVNDFFFGYGLGIKDHEFWIFDRWGNEIFHCHTINELPQSPACQWDGIVQAGGLDMNGNSGKMAQIDVYVWKAEIIDIFDKPHKYIGTVTIVR